MSEPMTLQQIRDFKGTYPKQLFYLFGTEMWERFCFYGLRGMLVVFMATEMMMPEKQANLQYGAIQAFVYAFTFLGGVFADKILGFQKSLFWGALLMIVGGFVIAAAPKELFYIGICFNIIGTGFFKPNISTMVGQLYHEGDARRDAGFGLFYMGINVGAFLGGLLMVWVGKSYSWRAAFALVGVVMIISLINFAWRRKTFGPIGLSPLHPDMPAGKRKLYEWGTYLGSLAVIPLILLMVTNTQYTDLFMYIVGPLTLVYLAWEMRTFSRAENLKLGAALIFIFFSIFFWAFFEQSGGSLSLFALNNLRPSLFGIPVDTNSVNNAANSLFVIAFSALVGLVWLWLSKRGKEPNSVVKFGLGFLFLGAGFYIFKSTLGYADESGITSTEVFTFAWFVITFGELCLSPIGLSLMTKLSPLRIQGLMMGMWFLASAYGQYAAGLLGAGMSAEDPGASNYDKLVLYTDGYGELGLYALIAGGALILIAPLVRRMMQEVR
ncbi:MAG TPA: peptide MFS transporter [Flavobacteriales bacterium]|nr:peptide MFS transporter [Flavobacteriales bacterium]